MGDDWTMEMFEIAQHVAHNLDAYRADLERYERELANARITFTEEHPLVRLWSRRKRAAALMIELLEKRYAAQLPIRPAEH